MPIPQPKAKLGNQRRQTPREITPDRRKSRWNRYVLESGTPRQEELRTHPKNQIPHTLKKFITYAKQMLRNTNNHSFKPTLSISF
jgi:hypothetical protein